MITSEPTVSKVRDLTRILDPQRLVKKLTGAMYLAVGVISLGTVLSLAI